MNKKLYHQEQTVDYKNGICFFLVLITFEIIEGSDNVQANALSRLLGKNGSVEIADEFDYLNFIENSVPIYIHLLRSEEIQF